MQQELKYCQQKAIQSGSSFYYSFLFLPKEQKEAITVVYAFCREVDDIVDECTDQAVATQKLGWWASEIDRVFTGQPQHPVGIALATIVPKFKLQRVWFDEILHGMHMDLKFQGYQTMADLKIYCHCVASTVGMLAATIFGYDNPDTLEYAKELGLALQTINIIRDIGEDARRNRIYLPEEILANYSITPQEILACNIQNNENFKAMLKHFAAYATQYYHQALSKLSIPDRIKQRSGLIMAKIYFCILQEIERADFEVLSHKISITPLRKLWQAICCFRYEQKFCNSQDKPCQQPW